MVAFPFFLKGIKAPCFTRQTYVVHIVCVSVHCVLCCLRSCHSPREVELWRGACEKVIWLERHPAAQAINSPAPVEGGHNRRIWDWGCCLEMKTMQPLIRLCFDSEWHSWCCLPAVCSFPIYPKVGWVPGAWPNIRRHVQITRQRFSHKEVFLEPQAGSQSLVPHFIHSSPVKMDKGRFPVPSVWLKASTIVVNRDNGS